MTFTNAHKMIADLVSDMAHSVYDELALDDKWYATHKNRRRFVRRHLDDNAVLYVKAARAYLATLLTDPYVSQDDKDKIHHALCLDAAIRGPADDQVKPLTIV